MLETLTCFHTNRTASPEDVSSRPRIRVCFHVSEIATNRSRHPTWRAVQRCLSSQLTCEMLGRRIRAWRAGHGCYYALLQRPRYGDAVITRRHLARRWRSNVFDQHESPVSRVYIS
ncbi:hypothetical protein IF2G_09544 [Cordyceps javanica]|nr:hypothetical protein IF2G_09544 [Cordyceps javanica]